MTEWQKAAQRAAEQRCVENGYNPPVAEKDHRGRRPKGSITVALQAEIMQINERGIYRVRAVRYRNPWLHNYLVENMDLGIRFSDAVHVADRCVPVLMLAIERVRETKPRKMTLRAAVLEVEAEIYIAMQQGE